MVIGFQVSLPGDAVFNQRFWEKRDLPGRCFRIGGRQEGDMVSLCYLLFDKMMKNILCSTIVLGWNRDPGRCDLCYPHIPFLDLSMHHSKSARADRHFYERQKYLSASIILLLLNSVTRSLQL